MADPHAHAATGHAAGHIAPAPGHGDTAHGSIRTYVNIAIALTVITAIEVATLYIPGIPNTLLVASLILMSVAKFVMVVGFYMHLRYDSRVFTAMFVGPLLIAIGIILALMALFGAYILLPRP